MRGGRLVRKAKVNNKYQKRKEIVDTLLRNKVHKDQRSSALFNHLKFKTPHRYSEFLILHPSEMACSSNSS